VSKAERKKRLTRSGLALLLLSILILTSCSTESSSIESRLASSCGNPARIMVVKDKLSTCWVLSGDGAEKLEGETIRVLAHTHVTRGKGQGDPNLIAKQLIDMWKSQSGSFQATSGEITQDGSQAKVFDCITGDLKETTLLEVAEILALQSKE
jgi:hypothetical protein